MHSVITKMGDWSSQISPLLQDESRYSEGWSLSNVDTSKALAALPNLALEAGWRLITFQYMKYREGESVTFAVPLELMGNVGNWLEQLRNPNDPPAMYLSNHAPLRGAKWHFMDAVNGDGSPESFAQASILFRKIGGIGSSLHGSFHILSKGWTELSDREWELVDGCELPINLNPVVFIEENVTHCRFYVESDSGRRTISLYEDIYFGSSMRPETVRRLIAICHTGGVYR